MLTIAQIASPGEIAAARSLIREFTEWVLSFEKDAEQAPTFRNLEAELAALPGIYGPPTGRMLLATLDGAPAGCVAFRAHGEDTAEMKRMYVRPGCRGRNVGARLVAALIAEARSLGYRRMILDSHVAQTHAHAIYRAAGFSDIGAPADFPDEWRAAVIFMEMDLA